MTDTSVSDDGGRWGRALDSAIGWPKTLWWTLRAPRKLRPASLDPDANPPLVQMAVTLGLLLVVQAITGLDIGPIDRDFELPPALSGVHDLLQASGRFSGILGVLLWPALFALSALVLWLCWKLVDRRARLASAFRAQVYAASAVLTAVCLLLPLMDLAVLAAQSASLKAWAQPVGWLVRGLFLALAVWSLVWSGYQACEETGASRWRYAGAVILSGVAFLAASWPAPWLWPPKKDFTVASSSMAPSLVAHDQVTANLSVYRWRNPRRGEIVVYQTDARSAVRLARIVGLPGDRVELRAGRVILNGAALEVRALGARTEDTGMGFARRVARLMETAPGGRRYMVQDFGPDGDLDNIAAIVLPPGRYFLLGDNRDNALDSRVPREAGGPGPVAREALVGPVYRRDFPFHRPLDVVVPLEGGGR